jgi:hypothetical protein
MGNDMTRSPSGVIDSRVRARWPLRQVSPYDDRSEWALVRDQHGDYRIGMIDDGRDVAVVGAEFGGAVRELAGESASGRNRHLGVSLAMPDLNRPRDLVQRDVPGAAEQAAIIGGSLHSLPESISKGVGQHIRHTCLGKRTLIGFGPPSHEPLQRTSRSHGIGEPSPGDVEHQPRDPAGQHSDERPDLVGAGDDRARGDSIGQVVGTSQGIRSAGGVANESDALQPQVGDELGDVVSPITQMALGLVVREPQSRSIDANQADTSVGGRVGEEACLET